MVVLWEDSPHEVVLLGNRAYVLDTNNRKMDYETLIGNNNSNIQTKSKEYGLKVLLRSFIKPDNLLDCGWMKWNKTLQMGRNSLDTYQILMHNE